MITCADDPVEDDLETDKLHNRLEWEMCRLIGSSVVVLSLVNRGHKP